MSGGYLGNAVILNQIPEPLVSGTSGFLLQISWHAFRPVDQNGEVQSRCFLRNELLVGVGFGPAKSMVDVKNGESKSGFEQAVEQRDGIRAARQGDSYPAIAAQQVGREAFKHAPTVQ